MYMMLISPSRAVCRAARPMFCQMIMRNYSSEVTESVVAPMLLRLRSELKTAMKTKDTERRDVIKGVLANITNAEKNNQPIDTDEKIRKHLLKLASAQKIVAQQFGEQNRADLRDKELSQSSILEGYAQEIEVVGENDLREAISQIVSSLKANGTPVNTGSILKSLKRADSPLGGKVFDSSQVIALTKGTDFGG